MKRKILFLLLVLCSNFLFSQDRKDSLSVKTNREFVLLTGVNMQKDSWFAEVGIANYIEKTTGYHPFSATYFVSTELNAFTENKCVIGPKVGAWASGGAGAISIGANVIYYTDFHNFTLKFRPEIGVGIRRARIVYGYNLSLINKNFEGISNHVIGINYLIRVHKKN